MCCRFHVSLQNDLQGEDGNKAALLFIVFIYYLLLFLQVDFEQLSENLVQLERKCKMSWDNLKMVSKHETKALLKNKMTDFLKDCTERIIILKVVHRRIINR